MRRSRDCRSYLANFCSFPKTWMIFMRASGWEKKRCCKIHGDIFLTRCSRCDFTYREQEDPPMLHSGAAGEHEKIPKCTKCDALMRPGVVWFGEQLDPAKIDVVESYLASGACDIVIVAGTTATFGYIVDWALRASGKNGQLIEVNPEKTSLSQFATRVVREPAVVALPRLIDEL